MKPFGTPWQFRARIAPLLWLCCAVSFQPHRAATALTEETLARITFEQKLHSEISLGTTFRDETGRSVRLESYFGRKPVILVLGYYQCPMLCSLVLNGMVESLEDLKWSIGNQFEVVNISIAPEETARLASAKKATYVKRYGRAGAAQGWHFLTGDQQAIDVITRDVGFGFAYDAATKQYAHPSGLVVLTPQGKVSRYLLGVTFSPRELYSALAEASAGKVGSPVEKLILLCFHYNPITGKYGPAVMLTVRILGAATLAGIAFLIFSLLRKENRRRLPPPSAGVGAGQSQGAESG